MIYQNTYLYKMTDLGYILKQDLLNEVDSETLDELTGGKKAIGSTVKVDGDDLVWEKQRAKAIEYVKGYIRHWYDADNEMQPISEYNLTDTFAVGDRVASNEDSEGNRVVYECIQEGTGEDITDEDYFTANDTRNPVLVEITCVIIVYNLSRRKNPRQIPEQRQIDYDNAISDLDKIQKGRITLDIAEREDVAEDDAGQEFSHGDFDNVTDDVY